MTKIDIFSGFLGAGKTTLIKKLIKEAYKNEKLVLIENEFGEIGIDGGFMEDSGIEITQMNSGCICCSLVGDFGEALLKVLSEFNPDRILIEPSGVGKLSDVIRAVEGIGSEKAVLNSFCTVADVNKCKMYMKNFGEFFNDQIENASSIILSHTDGANEKKLDECISLIKEKNSLAQIITTPWDEIDGSLILSVMEKEHTLEAELEKLKEEELCPECGHHHHHHHHDEECHCHDHEHHHHEEECHCHDHEHHHGEECHCHDHEHHHEEECHCHDHEHHHDEECHCHDHEHHHHGEEYHCHDHEHHHHHADEVFTSWGVETAHSFTKEGLFKILQSLESGDFGTILRAKGIVRGESEWLYFDYIPGEPDIRTGKAIATGRLCVIGTGIDENKLTELFGV